MVLLHDVVEVLHLTNHDLVFTSRVDLTHGRFVGVTLVHRDLLGNAVELYGFFKEPQGWGQPGACGWRSTFSSKGTNRVAQRLMEE